jgi:hypothetical protein
MVKVASVCPHSGHRMRVFGRVAISASSEMTFISLFFELVLMTTLSLPISCVAPQELQTYLPSLGNIIEPHEQNML